MKEEGPPLSRLVGRLVECPADFLEDQSGTVEVAAVVSDLLRDLGESELSAAEAEELGLDTRRSTRDRNRRGLILLTCWVFHDPWFRSRRDCGPGVKRFIKDGLDDLALLVRASLFVTDPDRREEFSRLCLKALALRPAGETPRQAETRLAAIESVERDRLIRRDRAANGPAPARPRLSPNDFE